MRLEYYHRESQPGGSSTTAAYATAEEGKEGQHGAGGLRPRQGRAHPLARTLFQTIIQRQESGSFAGGGAQGRWLGQPLAATEPPAAEVAGQIERAGSEDGVVRGGKLQGAGESVAGISDNFGALGKVARHRGQRLGGDGARLAGLGEDDGGRARKQQAGDFIHRFIAHRAIDQVNPPGREMLLPEGQQLARAGGIVRAVEINCGTRLEPLEPPRPAHHRDATSDGRVINGKPALRTWKRPGSGSSISMRLVEWATRTTAR